MRTKYAKREEGSGVLLKTAAKSLSIISSRGQLTVPHEIRELCKIREGTVVAFEPQREGIFLRLLKVIAEDPYTEQEWGKIEKLRGEKGAKVFDAETAIKHIDSL